MALDDLIVEVGGWYETRDGRIVEITENEGTILWPWIGYFDNERERERCWADGGIYWFQSGIEQEDLVKRIPAPSNTHINP